MENMINSPECDEITPEKSDENRIFDSSALLNRSGVPDVIFKKYRNETKPPSVFNFKVLINYILADMK